MKRFIISILCVSVFLIGLGTIIEKTSAKFLNDDKAMEIIKNARIALGGDANISEVKSMTIVATTTNFFERDGVQDVKQGSLEINMKMPGHFSKKVSIGDPGDGKNVEFKSNSDFVFMQKDGEKIDFTSKDGTKKKGVFVIKRGKDGKAEWNSDTDGKVKVEGDKVIITKEDGTTEEINLEGKNKFRVKIDGDSDIEGNDKVAEKVVIVKDKDGKILTENVIGSDNKKVIVVDDKDGNVLTENVIGPRRLRFGSHRGHNNEMLRTTMALLLTAPENSGASYKYAGSGNVDGNPSNIIEVSSNGSSFKLYLDASTNLPQMVSYQSNQNMFFFKKGENQKIEKEALIEMKKDLGKSVEHQVKFSDFRSVGNLLLPHRWTKSVGGKPSQNTDITSYEINPANIDEKLSHKKFYLKRK